MGEIILRYGDNFTAVKRELLGVGKQVADQAVARALNRVGAMTFTRVVRNVTRESGAARQRDVRRGFKTKRAWRNRHRFEIAVRTNFFTLSSMNPRERKKSGRVTARGWDRKAGTRTAYNKYVFGITAKNGKRVIVKLRQMETADRQEQDSLLEIYRDAVGV